MSTILRKWELGQCPRIRIMPSQYMCIFHPNRSRFFRRQKPSTSYSPISPLLRRPSQPFLQVFSTISSRYSLPFPPNSQTFIICNEHILDMPMLFYSTTISQSSIIAHTNKSTNRDSDQSEVGRIESRLHCSQNISTNSMTENCFADGLAQKLPLTTTISLDKRMGLILRRMGSVIEYLLQR
jgi:hypothetical protein